MQTNYDMYYNFFEKVPGYWCTIGTKMKDKLTTSCVANSNIIMIQLRIETTINIVAS